MRRLSVLVLAFVVVAACAPSAPSAPAPTTATVTAPAKPAEAPAGKPAATAKPTDAPAAKPAEAKPAASPAALAEAKPAAKPADDFYAGKTIRIITGFTPGGQFDGWSRLLAKHMPRYIPGNPTMIVENMAGAASLIAANHIYNVAPKDGTVIGNFIQTQVLNQVRGAQGIEFDMQKYEWIGAMANATIGCVAREETGVKTLADVIPPASKQVVMGASGPGSGGYDYPVTMEKALGANIKLVSGYPGNAEVRLAIERGEVDGYCVSWDVLKPTLAPWKEAGTPRVNIFVQASGDEARHPEMADVPVIWDFIKRDEDRQVFRLLMAPEQFYWPFAMPPGTPPERVQTIRNAWQEALKDPAFKADADKAGWTYQGVSHEKIISVIKGVMDTPEPIKKRFIEYLEGSVSAR